MVGISVYSKLVELAVHVEDDLDPDEDDLELFVYERFLATISRAYEFHCNKFSQARDSLPDPIATRNTKPSQHAAKRRY